jgi:hypothetical protein
MPLKLDQQEGSAAVVQAFLMPLGALAKASLGSMDVAIISSVGPRKQMAVKPVYRALSGSVA